MLGNQLLAIGVVDAGAVQAINDLSHRLATLGPVMDRIGVLLESRVDQRFDTKTDPDGAAWSPWGPATAAARQAEGRGTLLEYSGHMRASLAYVHGADWVEVGFGVPYAISHETGAGVPERRMLAGVGGGLGQRDMRDVMQMLEAHLAI